MTDAIAHTLFYDNLQIAFVAIGLVVACVLSIYNLPWEKVEWNRLMNAMRFQHMTSGSVSIKADLVRKLRNVLNSESKLHPNQKQIHSSFPISTESESTLEVGLRN